MYRLRRRTKQNTRFLNTRFVFPKTVYFWFSTYLGALMSVCEQVKHLRGRKIHKRLLNLSSVVVLYSPILHSNRSSTISLLKRASVLINIF